MRTTNPFHALPRVLALAMILMAYPLILNGQASMASLGSAVSQDFNTLTSGSWADNTTLTGWYARTTATASITAYAANTGSTTTGGFYAFGVAGVNPLADRALGYATSNAFTGSAGSGKNYMGWRLKNNTGSSIDSLIVVWTGEQWRREANTSAHTLILTYQKGSTVTDLNSGSWTSVSSTFTSPQTGSTASVLDGNAAANRVAGIKARIYINLAAGEEVMLRWEDLNDSGSDHFLTIDDVSATPRAEAVAASISVSANLDFGDQTEGSVSAEQSYTVIGSGLSQGIGVKAPAGFTVSTVSGGPFGDSITLAAAGGTVIVRFEPLAVQLYTGNIKHSSAGAPSQYVPVSGNGTSATPPGPVTEVLAAWDFSGLSSYGPSPMPPSAQSALVTVVGLTRGAGVLTGGTAASNAWGGTGWNVSDAPTAAAGNKFATFSLSAPAGYLLSLTSVEPYNVRRSSTGPTLGQWQYSLNGTDFLNIGSAITWGGNTTSAGNLQAAIDLSAISGLQQLEGGSTVTMRLLIYGATQETGTWYFNQFQTSHDLIIQGTLLALPDTTTFTGTGDWTEAARWSHGIPGSVTHVIIDGTATLSNNASIRSLEVSASGTLTIADGDTLAVTGDVTHHGGVLSPASGTLRVAGSLRQTIGGSSALVLNDLVLDNPQGLRLGCDLLIPAGLRMTQGKVRTGAFALTLGGSAMVAGCDDAHYVWGTLRHAVNPGDHLKHFCIGDSLRYTPVEVDLGNVSTGGTLSAALVEGPHPQQASSGLDPLRCLPYFWTFNNNGIAFDQYDAVFVYPVDSANSISGSVDLMMERYSGGSWSVLNSGVGTPGELTVTAAAAFSDFQAGEACVQAEVPTLSADLFQLCPGGSTLAYVTNGSLGSATIWSWYADSCGGSALFTGDTVTLDPTLTTTYYVRGEGGCGSPGLCDTLRIELVTPPSGPSLLVKSPDLAQICRGQTASATFTSGSGGAGCADEYRYSLNNGGSWFVYTPGAGIGTGSATTVLVQGRRESCDAGSGCAGTAWQTLASWVTVAAPTGPVLASRFPNLGTVCEGAEVTATINPGSGGVGCSDSLRYSLDNGAGWASYSSGDTLPTAGASVVIIQGRRADCTPGAGCTGTSWTSLAQWTVIAQPSGPVLSARMPDLDTLCQGTDVSATFAAGSGGVGCADQYRVSSDSGVTWSPYTAPALINTAAASTVILQGRRSGCTPGAGCSGTAYADLAVWHFVPQPTGPTLASKDPDLVVASEGTTVSATFNPGSGGIGCADTFRYSIDNGLNWSVYAPASLINTSGASLVIIQGARMGCSAGTDCSGTPFVNLASWLVNAPPLAPELDSRLPDQDEVCEGIPLSATFLEGSGGVDCEDFYRYSIDSGDTWLPYVPGSPIMASGPAHVLVQTQRSDCLSGIPTPWTTRAAWKVNPYSTVTFQLPMHAVCKNATGFKLSGGLPAGGTYSGPAVSANTFFPALSAPGPQTITYTYRNIHQCVSAAQDILQVNPLPVVTLSVTYLCEDAGLAALSKGTPAGGTYSGAHVQGGSFNTTTAGVGTHGIMYSYTDGQGCTQTVSGQVVVVPLPVISLVIPAGVCAGAAPYVLTGASPVGGTWSGTGVNGSLFDPQGLNPGDYPIAYTYTDPHGCTATASTLMNVRPLPVASAGPDHSLCLGQCVTLQASGGLQYQWSTGAKTAAINQCPQDTMTYTVTVTDGFGCQNADQAVVFVRPVPASVQEFTDICAGECAQLSAPAGISYLWTQNLGVQSSVNVCPTQTLSYAVTVTNAHQCSRTSVFQVNVKPLPPVYAGNDQTVCKGDTGILQATGATSYLWGGTGGSSAPSLWVSPQQTTTYTLTGTGANGCTASDAVVVTVNPLPHAAIGPLQPQVCRGECIELVASGGVDYQWGAQQGSARLTVCPETQTSYTVTVTDAQGCSAIAQTIVTVRPGPLVGAGPDDTLTIGQSHLFAQASASGTGPMTFAWFPSFTVADPGALHAVATPYVTSEYSLFVTDAYGCTHSDTALLVVLPQGNTLSGRLMYAADPAFALPGVKVVMLDIAAKTADTTSTDNQGVFRFVNLPSGSYVMEGVSGQAAGYGAVNATDALGVMLHFAGVQPLTDLPLKAGDVNLASGVNSTDALHIGQYFSGLLPEFAAGDWTFESDTFVFSAQTFHSRTFQALLTGDVNASYDAGTKSGPVARVEYDGQIQAGMGEILRLPLSLDQDAELGALSVHLILPAGLELTGLDLAPGVAGHLSYGKTGPLVRIAWFAPGGTFFQAGQPILEMRVQVQGSIAEGVIQAGEFLELSDPMGRIDTELKLRLPRLSTKADAGLELVAWPNPFREETRLNFSLPEEGQVSMILVNALGESIVILDEARMSAGPHSLSLLPGTAPGVYLCRLEFRAGQEIRHHTLRLIRAL